MADRPTPPADLWENLDAARIEAVANQRPPDSFSTLEYETKYGLPHSTAKEQLRKLCAAGVLKRVETNQPRRLVFFQVVKQDE